MPLEDFAGAVDGSRLRCFAIGDEKGPRSPDSKTGSRDEPHRRLSPVARHTLQRWIRAATTPQRVARRSRIVLAADDGGHDRDIAERLHTSPVTVRLWCDRVARAGVDVIWRDAPGRGRKRTITPETAARIIAAARATGQNPPPTVRALAKAFNVSAASVCRILKTIEKP